MTYSIDIINQFIEYASKNNNLSLYSSTSNISKKTLTAWYHIYNYKTHPPQSFKDDIYDDRMLKLY
jgi:hypothetical protein